MTLATREFIAVKLKDLSTCGHCGEIRDERLITYGEFFFCHDGRKHAYPDVEQNSYFSLSTRVPSCLLVQPRIGQRGDPRGDLQYARDFRDTVVIFHQP